MTRLLHSDLVLLFGSFSFLLTQWFHILCLLFCFRVCLWRLVLVLFFIVAIVLHPFLCKLLLSLLRQFSLLSFVFYLGFQNFLSSLPQSLLLSSQRSHVVLLRFRSEPQEKHIYKPSIKIICLS